MIKHRFILRDVNDFRVFAAIPVEIDLLAWKRWKRPPDWKSLRDYTDTLIGLFEKIASTADVCVQSFLELIGHINSGREKYMPDPQWDKESVGKLNRGIPVFLDEVQGSVENHRPFVRSNQLAAEAARSLLSELGNIEIEKYVYRLEKICNESGQPPINTDRLKFFTVKMQEALRVKALSGEASDPDRVLFAQGISRSSEMALSARDNLIPLSDEVFRILECFDELLFSTDPLPDTPCPVGLPFAAYTVEFSGTVVSVVEGCAWVSATPKSAMSVLADKMLAERMNRAGRKSVLRVCSVDYGAPSEDVKRVVEIVSQMLTERALNPHAPTKISVRETDPAKAHQTREAEHRAPSKSFRTIKFEVTPPRYLREAAEQILASPMKAHWVRGHWRNQPYGEKHALRRRTWVLPHIRGLGEASATVARIVAPKEPRDPKDPKDG
jgi:hypothetical protein